MSNAEKTRINPSILSFLYLWMMWMLFPVVKLAFRSSSGVLLASETAVLLVWVSFWLFSVFRWRNVLHLWFYLSQAHISPCSFCLLCSQFASFACKTHLLSFDKCYETWPWILAFLCNIVNDAGNMEQIQQWLVGWYFKEILPPISWNLLLKHHISFILSIWWFHFILVYLENVFFK